MFAIVPPPDQAEIINGQRLVFAQQYGFKRALKPPVHITLVPPFHVPQEQVPVFERLILRLSSWTDTLQSFDIELKDFGFFENPAQQSPVVFIDVVQSAALQALYQAIRKRLSVHPNIKRVLHSSYNPHVTIGYRDLSWEAFPAIRADYRQRHFTAYFPCKNICLWKHDGINWRLHHAFSFDLT
jgi:2'-5' RNA ligase